MRVGVISGSAMHPRLGSGNRWARTMTTSHGRAEIVETSVGDHDVVHLARHGPGGARLSHQVDHLANLAALREADIEALISFTVCGTVDPDLTLGCVVVFDDLFFPGNRLPDGSLCTWFDEPGRKDQGHWIAPRPPFSQPLREALIEGAKERRMPYVMHAVYGHIDGPRYETACETMALARLGVSVISQTAGPEVVLAGEAGIPMALVGYVTDYANGAGLVPEPLDVLDQRMRDSEGVFATLLEAALPKLTAVEPVGSVHRFH